MTISGNVALTIVLLCTAMADADPPRVVSAQPAPDLDAVFARTKGWIGADGNYSVPIAPDYTLWFFSDTWIGEIVDGKRTRPTMINNSVGVETRDGQARRIVYHWGKSSTGKAEALIRPADGKGWYWPLGGAYAGRHVHLLLHQIERTGAGGAFGFRGVGVWHGEITNPHDPPEQWEVKQRKLPFTELSDNRHLTFGAAVMKHGDFVYIYGTDERPKDSVRIRQMVVARVLESAFADFEEWRFWDGRDWHNDFRKVAGIAAGMATEYSVTWVPDLKRFVNITHDNFLSPKIVARSAEQPWGPWSKSTNAFTCPEGGRKGVFTYSGKAHAHLSQGKELVITYAANANQLSEVINDTKLYWPRFVRVRLELE